MEQILTGRRIGRTTRMIDAAVQHLFTEGVLCVYTGRNTPKGKFMDPDHRESNMAQSNFVSRLMKRLQLEHGNSIEYDFDSSSGLHTFTAINQYGKQP